MARGDIVRASKAAVMRSTFQLIDDIRSSTESTRGETGAARPCGVRILVTLHMFKLFLLKAACGENVISTTLAALRTLTNLLQPQVKQAAGHHMMGQ